MDAIVMTGMAFLFVFAVTYAMMTYNNLKDSADLFISYNSVSRRSDLTTEQMATSEITRKVKRAEVLMAIFNFERTIQTRGNNDYVIKVGNTIEISYEDNVVVYRLGGLKVGVYSSDLTLIGTNVGGSVVEDINEMSRLILLEIDNPAVEYDISYTDSALIYS